MHMGSLQHARCGCIQDLYWVQVVAPQYSNYLDAWETGVHKRYNVSGQVTDLALTCFSWPCGMLFTFGIETWLPAASLNSLTYVHFPPCPGLR
jgi:hypothetical protein